MFVSTNQKKTERRKYYLVLLLHVWVINKRTFTNKTRLQKRKQEMQDLRKEKQTVTSKKHLGEHMYEAHSKNDDDDEITCDFCGDNF